MCGIALPLGLLVPDGGLACADIRWYCKDAKSCTERWTTAGPPGPATDARGCRYFRRRNRRLMKRRPGGWTARPRRQRPPCN